MVQLERLSPEVVIFDRDLPGLPPAELVACLRQAQNQLVIIMLISAPLERCFSVKLDVDYVISKVDPPGRMLDVIRSAGNPRPKKPPA
jgi:DNA-binding NarL/FixJ family response regulator